MRSLQLLFNAAALGACFNPANAFTAQTTEAAALGRAQHKSLISSSASSADVDSQDATLPSLSFEPDTNTINRRTLLHQAIAATSTATLTAVIPQSAAYAATEKPPPIIPLLITAQRLRRVPLFTIVDGNGTPFHTYDKDTAGGFGYFFTSYTSATYVLDDAQKAFAKAKTEAANKKEAGTTEGSIGEDGQDDVPDAWGQAQIVTLPLDKVLQLSVKKTSSVATNGKGKTFTTYYQVIPSTVSIFCVLVFIVLIHVLRL